MIFGNTVIWTPESRLTPSTSTSSWTAAVTTSSGRAVQAGIDDVHAGVAQRAGDHLHAAVVAVEPDLGQQHADRLLGHAVLPLSLVQSFGPCSSS